MLHWSLGILIDERKTRESRVFAEKEYVDYYMILDVYKFATQEEIKKAYKQKARTFHPDNVETGNSKKFIVIRDAYEVLSDTNKKFLFDLSYKKINENKRYENYKYKKPEKEKTRDKKAEDYKAKSDKKRAEYRENYEETVNELSDEEKLQVIALFADENKRFSRDYVDKLHLKFFEYNRDLTEKESKSLDNIIYGFMIDLDDFLSRI